MVKITRFTSLGDQTIITVSPGFTKTTRHQYHGSITTLFQFCRRAFNEYKRQQCTQLSVCAMTLCEVLVWLRFDSLLCCPKNAVAYWLPNIDSKRLKCCISPSCQSLIEKVQGSRTYYIGKGCSVRPK